MNNLNFTGIYTYFYKDIDDILYMKVGKGKSIKKRLDGHLTSCAGLTMGPNWRTTRNSLHDSETKIKELLGKRYERKRDETFIIDDSIEEVTQYLSEEFNPNIIFNSKGKRNNVNYNVTTLFGVEDIREHRPTSYWNPSKTADVQDKVGTKETYKSVLTWMNKHMKKLPYPIRVLCDMGSYKIWRAGYYTGYTKAMNKVEEENNKGRLFKSIA